MKNKILSVMVYEPSWQYYVKYKQYLKETNHPFRDKIDFIVDTQMLLSEQIISQYPVVAFYYHDPLKILYPDVYQYAKKIESICAKHNIRMINRPDSLSNSAKSIQLRILADNGYHVAKSFPFKTLDDLSKIDHTYYPIFIRSDAGHDTDNESVQGPFYSFGEIKEKYRDDLLIDRDYLKGKVALQWIDTRFNDGLYRRYRTFACGENAVTGNMYVSPHWYIHSGNDEKDPKILEEKENFINKKLTSQEISFFVRANKILGLDFSAFDYSFTKDGQVIIWEANPHPAFPAWTEKEPSRSKVTNLISNEYRKILLEKHASSA